MEIHDEFPSYDYAFSRHLFLGRCIEYGSLSRIFRCFAPVSCNCVDLSRLHPLSHVPGPFLASITYLYQFKYNLLSKNSSFYLQIGKLHNQYGPVVRISPHEMHPSGSAHHQTINRVGTKFTKDPAFYACSFVSPLSMFITQDNALHRASRSVLAPLFTRARVLELERIVQNKVLKLCNSMQDLLASSLPVDIYHDVHCISVDVITEYAFDNCRNLLDTPDFAAAPLDGTKEGQPRLWRLR